MAKKPSELLSIAIGLEMEKQRLDKALAVLLANQDPPLSRMRLQALIHEGYVRLADKVVDDPSRKVKVGEIYTLQLPPPEPATPEAQKIKLDIVYEDKDLLVIN